MPMYQMEEESKVSPYAAAGLGALGGGGAVAGFSYLSGVKKTAIAGLVTGGFSAATQLLVSSQASNVQNNAAQIESAANALTFSAAATGSEVGALRAQTVSLASQVKQLAFNLQPSNVWGGQAAPLNAVPSATGAAGTALTQTTSSNNGPVMLLAVAALAYVALK